LVIGQVAKAHGVRGEMSVIPHTDQPERFNWTDEVYVGEESPVLFEVESVRFHKGRPLLKLAGCDSREEAQQLKGKLLQVPEDQAIPLEEGEYFLYQLIGLDVEMVDGGRLGKLTEVIETGANNVFVVQGEAGELLIPYIPEVVHGINLQQNKVKVLPFPGLLDA
jgi:16S rRNA processing protein RimM